MIYNFSKLNECPLSFIITLVLLVPILYFITRKGFISVLIPYVLHIIVETLIFIYVSTESRYKIGLFWSYKEWSKHWF